MQRYLNLHFTPPIKLIKNKITIFYYKYTIAFFIKCIKNSKFISFMENSQNDKLITNAPPKERDLFEQKDWISKKIMWNYQTKSNSTRIYILFKFHQTAIFLIQFLLGKLLSHTSKDQHYSYKQYYHTANAMWQCYYKMLKNDLSFNYLLNIVQLIECFNGS